MKVFRFLFTKVSFFSSLVKGGTCTRVCGFLKTFWNTFSLTSNYIFSYLIYSMKRASSMSVLNTSSNQPDKLSVSLLWKYLDHSKVSDPPTKVLVWSFISWLNSRLLLWGLQLHFHRRFWSSLDLLHKSLNTSSLILAI